MKFAFFSYGVTQESAQSLAKLVGKPINKCRIIYITTPTNYKGKEPDWMLEVIAQLGAFGFQVDTFDIEEAHKQHVDIAKKISAYDIFYVSGGNTFYFLYWAEQTDLKRILLDFMSKGGVYAGESAGAVCQIKDLAPIAWIDDPEQAPGIVTTGMQLTDLVILPHWQNPEFQAKLSKTREYYESLGVKTYMIKDGEAIFVDGDEISFVR